jgi:hypothetical protein
MAGFNMDDYVDVAERVQQFYAKYPDGRLCTVLVKYAQWPSDGIFVQAEAYRTADDPHPGVGSAWEPVPGKTSFTRDSEVQNAETAAWGRAIASVGIATKKIASADEVRARRPESPRSVSARPARAPKAPSNASAPPTGDETWIKPKDADESVIDQEQRRMMFGIARGRGLTPIMVKAYLEPRIGVASTAGLQQWQYDNTMLWINEHAEVQP